MKLTLFTENRIRRLKNLSVESVRSDLYRTISRKHKAVIKNIWNCNCKRIKEKKNYNENNINRKTTRTLTTSTRAATTRTLPTTRTVTMSVTPISNRFDSGRIFLLICQILLHCRLGKLNLLINSV